MINALIFPVQSKSLYIIMVYLLNDTISNTRAEFLVPVGILVTNQSLNYSYIYWVIFVCWTPIINRISKTRTKFSDFCLGLILPPHSAPWEIQRLLCSKIILIGAKTLQKKENSCKCFNLCSQTTYYTWTSGKEVWMCLLSLELWRKIKSCFLVDLIKCELGRRK